MNNDMDPRSIENTEEYVARLIDRHDAWHSGDYGTGPQPHEQAAREQRIEAAARAFNAACEPEAEPTRTAEQAIEAARQAVADPRETYQRGCSPLHPTEARAVERLRARSKRRDAVPFYRARVAK